ncbi:DegV family protein, partial [Streptococcus agalactiae]
RQEGKSLEEVKQKIESLLPKLNTYFLVDDLNHLMRSGRLSKGAAIIGSVAKIKPLLKLDSEGKLVPFAKTRGRKKGIKEIVTQATKTLSYSTLIIAYSGEKDSAQVMKEQLLADERIEEVIIRPLGPVISAHVGSGALALFSLGEENR